MKMIHCADLHLDSKMESNLSAEKARERREELLQTFERMVEAAEAGRVRAILIAGDLFDKPHNRKAARRRVLDQITSHPDIDFLYLKGNHDDTDFLVDVRPEDIPSNLKSFRQDQWTTYFYEEDDITITVTGREITAENSRNMATGLVLDQANVNIVMLHGQESLYDGNDKAEVINRTEYRGKNIDYLALGHIHSFRKDRLDDRGSYCYAGCLEGRGFDECGPKGYVLLDIEDRQVKANFVPFAYRTLHEVEVELDEDMDMPAVLKMVEDAVLGIPSQDLVKITLSGRTDMNLDLDLRRIERIFGERFYFVKAVDQTSVKIDYESFRNDHSLKGEFVRLLEGEDRDEKMRASIIETGMRAILGEDIDE